MDVCKCGKEKELGQLETKVDKLEKRDTELYEKINKNVDKINAIEKISFQIGIFAEKLIELTEEIKNIKRHKLLKELLEDWQKNKNTKWKKILK